MKQYSFAPGAFLLLKFIYFALTGTWSAPWRSCDARAAQDAALISSALKLSVCASRSKPAQQGFFLPLPSVTLKP